MGLLALGESSRGVLCPNHRGGPQASAVNTRFLVLANRDSCSHLGSACPSPQPGLSTEQGLSE